MKNFIKRILYLLGIKEAIDQKMHQRKVDNAIKGQDVEKRFSNIYDEGVWFSNKESSSGSGSTLDVTKKVREWLPKVLDEKETNTLVDIGCGDFNWMKEIQLNCNYIGTDIVKSVIDKNNELYKTDKITFIHSNAIEDKIPDGDVVICRDVLFHLSFSDGLSLIENLKNSTAKYLITTSHKDLAENEDIYTGNFRKIRLEIAPYNFPKPINELFESDVFPDRFLGIWDLDHLRKE